MFAFGSFSVPTSAAVIPGLAAPSPGSLVLINTGPNAITIGGSGVTAGATGPGMATIPNGGSVPLNKISNLPPGQLFAVAATGASTLNWFYGTEVP